MRKEKERKEQLRKETERKRRMGLNAEKGRWRRNGRKERGKRAAKLVEEEKEREEEKRKEAPFVKTATTNVNPLRRGRRTKLVFLHDAKNSNREQEGGRKAQKQQQQHAAPNPLPDPEHHDDVNPDHALNIDDHADVPKRHAPFVDGVVAQFFVMLVTTLSIWLKTMFRKIHEYRLAKQREREENEKEMLGDMSSWLANFRQSFGIETK